MVVGEESAAPRPSCSVCFNTVANVDEHHYIDLTGVCPAERPCKLCATCARRCLEQCANTLNARSQEAEVLQSLGAPGRAPVCLSCRRSAVTPLASAPDDSAAGGARGGVSYDLPRLEALVLGDPTCACVDCAHARGGPQEAARVAEAEAEAEAEAGGCCGSVASDSGPGATQGWSPVGASGVMGDGAEAGSFHRALDGGNSVFGRRQGDLRHVAIVVPRALDPLYVDGMDPDSPRVAASTSGAGAAASAGAAGPPHVVPAIPPATLVRMGSITVAPGRESPRPRVTRSSSGSSLGSSLCSGCGGGLAPTVRAPAQRAMTGKALAAQDRRKFLGHPAFARRLWRRVLEHRAVMQLAYRCPFGVFKRCPVPGCESREYLVFDERSQFMRFMACNHEVCRNCERLVRQRGPMARRNHNKQCMVTLGSQLVRKQKNWDAWHVEPAYEAAVRAMHEYTSEVVSRRQRLECPRCGVVVAKTGSCNHIVCECGEHLCQACHRRLADMLPHPVVKAANAHAVAPYGTYVAVDEVAMVQNHYEVGGWKRQEPQKRLCPRLFSEVADWFPTVLGGEAPAPGQTTPVGLGADADGSDHTELNRHSQAVRLRILALILNRRVVTKSALAAVASYDKERNRGQLMELWPAYPYLSVHELMYVMWEWGRVDRLSNMPAGGAQGAECANTWVYVPKNTAFHYDPHATYKPVDVLALDIFSDSGSEQAVLGVPSMMVAPTPAAAASAAATDTTGPTASASPEAAAAAAAATAAAVGIATAGPPVPTAVAGAGAGAGAGAAAGSVPALPDPRHLA